MDKGWEERVSYETYMKLIMAQKNPPGKSYATWMVSNCGKTRGATVRWEYAQQLIAAGLKLDGFGKCFNKVIMRLKYSNIYSPTKTQWGHFAPYKFYLAFENSIHCNDYLSEKFWRNALFQGLVPVVYGPHRADLKVS